MSDMLRHEVTAIHSRARHVADVLIYPSVPDARFSWRSDVSERLRGGSLFCVHWADGRIGVAVIPSVFLVRIGQRRLGGTFCGLANLRIGHVVGEPLHNVVFLSSLSAFRRGEQTRI